MAPSCLPAREAACHPQQKLSDESAAYGSTRLWRTANRTRSLKLANFIFCIM
jgi:hypothetical protein